MKMPTKTQLSALRMASNSTTACPLLELPAELRNRIWEQVIVKEGPISLAPASDLADGEELETGAQPALSRVCRQIREETLPMFYAHNIFRLHPENMRRYKASRSKKPLLRSLRRHTEKLRRIEIQACQHNNRYRLTVDPSLPSGFVFEVVYEDEVYNNTETGRYCNLSDPKTFDAACVYLEKAYIGFGIYSDQLVKLCRKLF